MTPAEEILAAADHLEHLALRLQTEGQPVTAWHAEECGDPDRDQCPCIIGQGTYTNEFDGSQSLYYVADCETPEIAAYITAMGPNLAVTLVSSLRSVAAFHEPVSCTKHDECDGVFGCDWCGDEDWPCVDMREALAVARALMGVST